MIWTNLLNKASKWVESPADLPFCSVCYSRQHWAHPWHAWMNCKAPFCNRNTCWVSVLYLAHISIQIFIEIKFKCLLKGSNWLCKILQNWFYVTHLGQSSNQGHHGLEIGNMNLLIRLDILMNFTWKLRQHCLYKINIFRKRHKLKLLAYEVVLLWALATDI